jgi:phage gp16-like protein
MSNRRAMLAKIHVARKQLGWDEPTYRDVLRRVTGADSAASLTAPQLDAVLTECRRLGWQAKPRRVPAAKAQVRMIRAVWRDLAALGVEGGDAALRTFVRRQTRCPAHPDGVDAPEFLDGPMGTRVLEGLKAWRARLKARAG